MTDILLDTCAVVWTGNNEKLTPAAVVAIDESYDRNRPLYVSPVTAWELGLLVSQGHCRLSMGVAEWFAKYLDNSAARMAELSPNDLIASSFLPGNPPNDPLDRILIATARQHGYHIMSRDRRILDYAEEGHVNAIAC